jgi:hypothetical protein
MAHRRDHAEGNSNDPGCGLAGSRVLQRSSSPGSDTPPRGPIRRKARDCPNGSADSCRPPRDRWCVFSAQCVLLPG